MACDKGEGISVPLKQKGNFQRLPHLATLGERRRNGSEHCKTPKGRSFVHVSGTAAGMSMAEEN